MEKECFISNFRLLLVHLDKVTRELCSNDLSTNYMFILEADEWTTSSHLTTEENEYLQELRKIKNKQLSFDQVVELLFKNGTAPNWADCHVYYSTAELTVVKIFFSRQFRDEREIYYLERGTGPFKAVVAMPFDYAEDGKKFDVNWKKNWDKRSRSGLWTKIKLLMNIE